MAAWQLCDTCGSVVGDWTVHVTWHQSLTPATTPAPAVAAAPTQPVGSA